MTRSKDIDHAARATADELFRLRVELADAKAARDQSVRRQAVLEAQNAALRTAVNGMAALITSIGLSTGK